MNFLPIPTILHALSIHTRTHTHTYMNIWIHINWERASY